MNQEIYIVADSGEGSLSGTNPLRFTLGGQLGTIQAVKNFVTNGGELKNFSPDQNHPAWASAPKLNGLFLYSHLRRHGFEPLLANDFDHFKTLPCLDQPGHKIIIISTTFIFNKATLNGLLEQIKTLVPDSTIIVGGHFVYFSYLLTKKQSDPTYDTESPRSDFLFLDNEKSLADFFITDRHGHKTLIQLLTRCLAGQNGAELPNIARIQGGALVFSEQVEEPLDPQNLKIDWDSLPDWVFSTGVVPMQASVGCPHHCAFCNFVKDHRFNNIKPMDELIGEMQAVIRRGARYIWFSDDNFRLGKQDLTAVCQRILAEGIKVRWQSFIRASTLQGVDFHLLKRAGCIEVQIGLESADAVILENMNKKATPALYAQVVKGLLQTGIHCSCYFIVGFPGETSDSVERTLQFIKEIESPEAEGCLSWSIFPFMLSPLSPIYEQPQKARYGLQGYMSKWKHATMDSDQAMKHVKQMFFALEYSGPIFRADNLDMLHNLGSKNRKAFIKSRQLLTKKSLRAEFPDPAGIMQELEGVFSHDCKQLP